MHQQIVRCFFCLISYIPLTLNSASYIGLFDLSARQCDNIPHSKQSFILGNDCAFYLVRWNLQIYGRIGRAHATNFIAFFTLLVKNHVCVLLLECQLHQHQHIEQREKFPSWIVFFLRLCVCVCLCVLVCVLFSLPKL